MEVMIKSVAMIVVPNFSIFEFATAFEVFGIDRSARGNGVPAFDFRVCTPVPGDVPHEIRAVHARGLGLEAAADADLVIMAPFGRDEDVPESVLDALRAAHARGAWVMSICSGAFALARAGLLDGRRCTTHWHYSQELASRYPAVLVDENVLYVEDSRIITSAGTAAGIDACLHLVRVEFGAKVAAAIARDMVVPPHRDGGQAQFIDRPIPQCGSEPMERAAAVDGRGTWTRNTRSTNSRRGSTCRRGRLPGASARKREPPRRPGSTPSGCCAPRSCWRPRSSISTKSPGNPASAIRSCCGTTSPRCWTPARSPTARTFRGHLATA